MNMREMVNPFRVAVAVVQGVCWDYSISLIETALFGRHFWWWRMYALSLREYGWLGPVVPGTRQGAT